MNKTGGWIGFFLVACLVGGLAHAAPQWPNRPKLIVLIVFDQFRSDFLTRFENRFLPQVAKNGDLGGFRFLMNKGAYYPYAEYGLFQSTTGPGHSTLLTGSFPYQSGLSSNYWFSPEAGKLVYCVSDSEKGGGVSPRVLNTTTVGDELKNAGYPSRVVTMALKDRAAILMGGHRADLSFWFEPKTPGWTTSPYYLKNQKDGKLPAWMQELNRGIAARKDEKYLWKAEGPGTGLSAPDAKEHYLTPVEKYLGKGFPYEFKFGSKEGFATPLGTELIVAAAEKAFDAYQLGRGKATDLFAVSFSNHDYLAHAFTPNSREMEEMTIAEDRAVSQLINHIRKKMGGVEEVVFVLTADHGSPVSPEWLKSKNVPAGRIDEEALQVKLNHRLKEKFGKLEKFIPAVYDFNFYLDRKAIEAKGLNLSEVEKEAKQVILEDPGVAYVVTSQEVLERRLPPGLLEKQVLHSYYKGRSGDLMIIPKPFFISMGEDNTTHSTGYTYDRMVPLIFVGKAFRPGVYTSGAAMVDLAPTLSFLLGVMPPATSEGRVLSEALGIRFGQ